MSGNTISAPTLHVSALKAAVTLITLLAISSFGSVDAEEPIDVLCLGAVESQLAPYVGWLKIEPSLRGYYVPARFYDSGWAGEHTEEILRSVRMYFPRTYESLSDFDFMILDSPVVSSFGANGIHWMRMAVEEGKTGATTMNSLLSKHRFCFQPFLLSELEGVFPNDGMRVVEYCGGLDADKLSMKIGTPYEGPFHVRVNREAPAVFTPFLSLGLESFVGGGGYLMFAKPGAFIWMWSVGNHRDIAPETPYLMSWDYGKGMAWSLSDNLRHGWWGWDMPAETHIVSENPYGLDILVNWIRYGTGREPIQEILAYHALRASYGEYEDLRNMIYSVLDFVSSFGGRTETLEARILENDEVLKRSKEYYVGNELWKAKEEVSLAVRGLEEITMDSMKVKDQTFFWIYLTQWLVVTSVSMVCGVFVWTLMVRRRMYREVGTTRAV